MLSHEEQRRLNDIADLLRQQDPGLARRLDPIHAQQRIRRHSDVRILLLVLFGAVVLSVGVATMTLSVAVGSLTAGLGGLLLAVAVRTATDSSDV